MISNAEIQRYHDYAELKVRRNIGSVEEQHLASMIINLVRVIDHLSDVLIKISKMDEEGIGKQDIAETMPPKTPEFR